MRLHIDNTSYKQKPKSDIGAIKARLQKSAPVNVTIAELAAKIAQGYCISPGVLQGGCSASNWTEQQVFMVDIDNDKPELPMLTPAEAKAICIKNNLPVSFMYHSFSSSNDKPKFRLVFVCEDVITDEATRSIIIQSLISLFDQADTTCSNADRIFFGTNKTVGEVDEAARFTVESAISAYTAPPVKVINKSYEDGELDRLKRDYDLLSYMQSKSGELKFNNRKCAMFKHCCICGHKDDLVYYHDSNTFMCFGANGHKGGSVIDFIVATENMDMKQAIEFFKYDLCKLEKKEFTLQQKKDYAIKKHISFDTDLLKYLSEIKPNNSYTFNDKGNGELFADVYKDLCRYNVTAKEWYVYDGKVWHEDTGAMQVSRYAKELADALLIYSTSLEDENQKKIYQDHASKLGQLKFRNTMLTDSRDKYFISNADLNKNIYDFNCQNGTLDLKTFEFRKHNPDDLLSKISNVIYDLQAKSNLFIKFVDEVMQGDQEKINYLQKAIGYALTGDTQLETCFILYGASTRNGKSTLIETISYMLGNTSGYAMNIRPETLAQKQNNDSRQASGDIARLNGCRFLNASEPPKRMIFDTALLKTLLGRDSITARHLHEREFEFIPIFKLFINTNYLPLITDDTLFTSGRINVISFDKHFTPAEQDKSLKDKLKKQAEISGIFNWCVDGLKKFYAEGLELPTAIIEATDEYRQNSDKVGNFINECLVKTGQNSKAKDVYDVYGSWCRENGYGVENKGNFFAELKAKGMFKDRGSINGVSIFNIIVGYEIESEFTPPREFFSPTG